MHGWLPAPPGFRAYFIDMEICSRNLDEYIRAKGRGILSCVLGCAEELSGALEELKIVLNILQHITSGLTFLHEKGEVHRDLKPKNGTQDKLLFSLCCSIIFRQGFMLEDRRLWIHFPCSYGST